MSWSFKTFFSKKNLVVNLISDNYWSKRKDVNGLSLFEMILFFLCLQMGTLSIKDQLILI
jgi:hypothetical protein